jgi:hypothetical protein
MVVAETACWDLANILKTFGLENRKKISPISSDDICLPFYKDILFHVEIRSIVGFKDAN